MLTADDTMAEDNLSISLDSFFKILDEVPAPPPPPTIQGSREGLHQDTLVPIDFGKTSELRSGMHVSTPLIGELGSSQWNSSSCMEAFGCKGESGMRLLSGSEGTFNDLNCMYSSFAADIGSFNSTHHGNSIHFCSPPANGSSDWLRASSSEDSGAEGLGLCYSPYVDLANDLYLNSGHEKGCLPMGGETSSPMKVKEPATDVNNISFFVLQNGEKDSAVRDCDPRSMSSHVDPGEMPSGRLHAETDINETLPSHYFHPLISSEKEATVQWKDGQEDQHLLLRNSCMPSEVKFVPHEEYLDTSITELSVIDLDIPLPYVPSVEQSHCEDLRLTGESSTDSSPVPSTRRSVSANIGRPVIDTSKQWVPDPKIASPNKRQKCLPKDKGEAEAPLPRQKQRDIPRRGCEAIKKNSSRISVDDDADICVLDDISDPVRPTPPSAHRNHYAMLQPSGYRDPHYNISGGIKLREDEERLTFQLALQNLSQPRFEASLPNGLLAVPLLRHQRIALSWMVQKETKNPHCCGGILADDQGLGKTISTIALILMERSPPSISCSVTEKPNKLEALDLEDDDDDLDVSVVNAIERTENSCLMSKPIKHESSVMVVKGRPAAGTLVVCPTSVLRQWAEELQNKVTSEANLSFLVYHGGNRTRDPDELAKYDVVLTTYAIVSIEVPKQPLVDKDDDEDKKKLSGHPTGCLTSKKRKNSQSSTTKTDSGLLESAARPLARVGWFRVILDEAQCIKNHRTQVARACWGLRAKRRWCLSGTPIQNAVDDLYSYFRFLKYYPIAAYKHFCFAIKMPINRNPTNGYKKLQAVLKTIMLRRTKGTLIDGKPIINLPPKTVTLKKVDFSEEERAFYSTLEAESQEQFKEYAAAGTVRQNYVNILLMLLRLRQACDHPLLVKGSNFTSIGSSSLELAKTLPRDKQIGLLSCLEAGMAICTICNDSPEDAVVTMCGHVFCNQCICEHLTGDEKMCPLSNCKTRLTIASVFCKSTLSSCLSGRPYHDCSSGGVVTQALSSAKIHEDSISSDSSKIRAALEILRSLPGSQYSSRINCFDKLNGTSTISLDNEKLTVPESCSVPPSEKKYTHLDMPSTTRASEKAIVFSQWTRMLDLLEIPLKGSCLKYRRLDGTMSVAAREKAVNDFNTLPEVTVMIMSLKAASLGLNMVAACHVLLLDLWWNPTTEDQAIDRAHRIGQTRPVTVSRLTVKETVEDRILALQEKKREMVASAFGEDKSGTRQSRLTVEDLKYLFMVN